MIGRMCPGVPHRGGSTRQLQLSMTGWRSPSGRDSQTASELFKGHKEDTWRVLHSRPLQRQSMRGLTLNCSAFCSCVAFGSPCLPFRAFAGVAVSSIPVATTAQHVRIRESLAVEGLQSKVLSPECAEKREGASRATSLCGIWMWVCQSREMGDAWKW